MGGAYSLILLVEIMQMEQPLALVTRISVFTYGAPFVVANKLPYEIISERMMTFCKERQVIVSVVNVVHNADIVPRLLGPSLIASLLQTFGNNSLIRPLAHFAHEFVPFGNFLILRKTTAGNYSTKLLCSEELRGSDSWTCRPAEVTCFCRDHLLEDGYCTALSAATYPLENVVDEKCDMLSECHIVNKKPADVPCKNDEMISQTKLQLISPQISERKNMLLSQCRSWFSEEEFEVLMSIYSIEDNQNLWNQI